MSWSKEMGGQTHFIHGNMVTLKENEFIMPQRKIADRLNWTQSAVARFLKKLVALNQCCIKNDSKMTRVSLGIVAVPQNPDSMLTQKRLNPDSLYDSFLGGGTNNDITNNYNINNNNNITKDSNTTNNNNIFKKPTKKVDTGDNSNTVVVKGKAKPFTAKPRDLKMVKDYFKEKHPDYIEQAEIFYNHYESVNWYKGKSKIKVWRRAVATWVSNVWEKPTNQGVAAKPNWESKFRKSPTGEFIVYCQNQKCSRYDDTLFMKNKFEIQNGCKCSHAYHPQRLNKPKPKPVVKEEFNEEELITFEEFSKSQRPKKSAKGSGTTKGDSKHISDLLGSLFQQR